MEMTILFKPVKLDNYYSLKSLYDRCIQFYVVNGHLTECGQLGGTVFFLHVCSCSILESSVSLLL